jgi:integrase
MVQHSLNRLNTTFVKSAPVGMHCDGGGLYLCVQKTCAGTLTKSWVFRYATGATATSANGKRRNVERRMGLGALHIVSLAAARVRAQECRQILYEGTDPIEIARKTKSASRIASVRDKTFKACATQYIAEHEAEWRNAKHREQWSASLRSYAFPTIGDVLVGDIDTALVLQAIKTIWATKPETAARVRGRIEMVLDWAKVHGYREGENPARWHGHLELALPKRTKVKRVKHHAALPYEKAPAFFAELQMRTGVAARALEFTFLCAARTGAVIGASWDEIDLEKRIWIVPVERIGAKITGEEPTPRRVPLSERAISIVKGLIRAPHNPFVFPGRFGGSLSNMAMLEVMREMRPGYVPHGLRSTFKDWTAETTAFPNEVSEAALWHVIDDKVEAAYRRGDLFEKRRRLMEAWAEYLSGATKADVITPLRAVGQQ